MNEIKSSKSLWSRLISNFIGSLKNPERNCGTWLFMKKNRNWLIIFVTELTEERRLLVALSIAACLAWHITWHEEFEPPTCTDWGCRCWVIDLFHLYTKYRDRKMHCAELYTWYQGNDTEQASSAQYQQNGNRALLIVASPADNQPG